MSYRLPRTWLLVISLNNERQPGPLGHALQAAKVPCFICSISRLIMLQQKKQRSNRTELLVILTE